jgi:uncharacterized membrane protein
MSTSRLEAFSDGVIAVIITIMVLELRAPAAGTGPALLAVAPSFLIYLLSFVVVAIMWVNHHHLLYTARRADVRLLWANNNLLFWMSLTPFVTAWMGTHPTAPVPVALYGVVLCLAAQSFGLLRNALARQHRDDPALHVILRGRGRTKARLASALYALSVGLAFVSVYLAYAVYVLIPALYFLPERQLESDALVLMGKR